MKIYDKAAWHIDGGEDEKTVINRFKIIFECLNNNQLLSEEGIEALEYTIDCEISLNDGMVTNEGKKFLDDNYDTIIGIKQSELKKQIENLLNK